MRIIRANRSFAFLTLALCLNLLAQYASAEVYDRIDQVKSEAFVSEYSLAVNGFFKQEIWTALDADCRAYILTETVDNESNYYGISPRFTVDVEELGCLSWDENAQIDDRFVMMCDKTAFGWRPDELYPSVLIDRTLLAQLDVLDALFVCHKAFYYAYAQYIVELLERNQLPEQYDGCRGQLEQYREDMRLLEEGESGVFTQLEEDAIRFGMLRSCYYGSYTYPDEIESMNNAQYRFYWRECLNGLYKQELLQRLTDSLCKDCYPGKACQIVSSVAEMEEHQKGNPGECLYILLDEDLLWNGEAADCILRIIQTIDPINPPGDAETQEENTEQIELHQMVAEEAWRRLKTILSTM